MLKSSANLKIVIDNSRKSDPDEDEMATDEAMLEINDESSGLEETTTASEETEFHVNLDKIPPTLQNTTLSDKVYLNESLRLESKQADNLDLISNEDLQAIYASLGLTESSFMTDEQANEPVTDLTSLETLSAFRREALHLFGVDELSTQEVFDYFKDFKAFAVEWINDSSCNVVWRNPVHAANALLGLSVEYNEENETRGVLKSSEEVEDGELSETSSKFANRLPPQGCRWRKGLNSVKNHQIFMRFVRKTDRKIKGAEAVSKYYVKYGNPNYGNMRGLLSSSMRNKLKSKQQRDAESDLNDESGMDEGETSRQPVAYDLDESVGENLSDGEIEEFGTGPTINVVKTSPAEIKLVTKSKLEFESRKGMGLYADELPEQKPRRLYSDDLSRPGDVKKNRYQPYSLKTSTKPSSLVDRLSGLRPGEEGRSGRSSRAKPERLVERERDHHKPAESYKKHSSFSRQKYHDDDDDSRSPPPRSGLKSTVKSVVYAGDDLRNKLNRFK